MRNSGLIIALKRNCIRTQMDGLSTIFLALADPTRRALMEQQQKAEETVAELAALARGRCDVLFAMLRDGTLYEFEKPLNA